MATVAKPPTDEHMRGDRPRRASLDDAPPADQASGIAVPGPRESYPIANTLLAIPRFAAYFLLLGPRYAAAEVDHYLESRSPNAFGRDVHATWRFGATLEAEKELGVAVAARVGRSFGGGQAVDAYAGGFGARGVSGGLRARLGVLTDTRLEPEITLDAGSGLDRAYAGIATRGPLATYELDHIAGSAAVSGELLGWRASARGTVDREHAGDGNESFMTSYGNDLKGFDETQRAATGELAITYDSRHPSYRWIKPSAPSTGTLFRTAVAQTSGTAERTGDFSFTSVHVDAQQMFDLFHGDRVLALGVSLAATTDDDIPFDRLPALGGERMRAFARDELRAQSIVYGSAAYEWPLGPSSRAYVFVEGAATPRARYGDAGGGIRLFNASATTARLQIAASPDGDVGAFLQLGAL